MQTKDGIRRHMRAQRKALSPEERARASAVICMKLIVDEVMAPNNGKYGCGGAVAVYLASPEEIDLSNFILEALGHGLTVVSPRWNGETYELARLNGLSERHLRRGPMNILEPRNADVVEPREVSAWIIPGLAFTKDGKRIGYGGGWYDRLLAAADGRSLKVGVAYEFQIVEDLPHDPHDISLDRVVTNSP